MTRFTIATARVPSRQDLSGRAYYAGRTMQAGTRSDNLQKKKKAQLVYSRWNAAFDFQFEIGVEMRSLLR